MSSFVIDKKEYIKAAGIVAGIAEASKKRTICGVSRELWVWDYEHDRNSTPEDYYRRFVECFEMNALSVAEQYKEDDLWTDSNDYKKDFSAAILTGKKLFNEKGEKLKNAIMELRQFFHSASYQTEKYEYMFKMEMYFYKILEQLMPYLWIYEPESWGDLKITA